MLAMEEVQAKPESRGQRQPLRLLACSGSLDGGGSERQLWQLVSHLDRQRFAPEVYLLNKRGPYLAQLPAMCRSTPLMVTTPRQRASRPDASRSCRAAIFARWFKLEASTWFTIELSI